MQQQTKSWIVRLSAGLVALVLLFFLTLFTLSAMGAGVWLWLGTDHDLATEPFASTRDLFTDYKARRKAEEMSEAFRAGEGVEGADGEDGVAEARPAEELRPGPRGVGRDPAKAGRPDRGGRSGSGSGGRSGSGSGSGSDRGSDGGDASEPERIKPDKGGGSDRDDSGGSDDSDDSSGCKVKGITRLSSTKYELTESFRKKYIKDSSKAQKQGKGAWHENNKGKTTGIEVWKLKCAPVQAGLRDDDIVREVAGKEMTGAYNAWRAYERVKKDDSFTIKVTRDGEKLTLKYVVK